LKTEFDHVAYWADYVKKNSNWKKIHCDFVDSQLKNRRRVMKELLARKNGKHLVVKLLCISNIKGFGAFLKSK